MNDFKQILSTISRPFKQEIRKGCQDDVVINGMGAYVDLWLGHARALELTADQKQFLNQIAAHFENYSGISPTERQKVIQSASEQINLALADKPLQEKPTDNNIESQKPQTTEIGMDTGNKRPTDTSLKHFEDLPLFSDASVPQNTTTAPPENATISQKIASDNQRHTRNNTSLFTPDTTLSTNSEKSVDNDQLPVILGDTPVSTDVESIEFLNNPLQFVKGIGPRRAEVIANEIDIHTVGGLLEYYPRDYIDRSKTMEIYSVGRREGW